MNESIKILTFSYINKKFFFKGLSIFEILILLLIPIILISTTNNIFIYILLMITIFILFYFLGKLKLKHIDFYTTIYNSFFLNNIIIIDNENVINDL